MPEAGPPRPWGEYELEEGCDHRVRIGPLHLRVRFTGGEVWLAQTRERGDDDEAGETKGDALEWDRWSVPRGVRSLRLSPAFPDRALVARPEHAFHLVRGAEVRVFVRVPLAVRVELVDPRAVTLIEIPTVLLSDTWFGDVMDGELMYFLPTTARREIRPDHFESHLAACPLQLTNVSTVDLDVERIALRVDHLSLFVREEELWADESTVRYRSAEEGSDIRMSGAPPAEAPDAELVTSPRVPIARGFRARTFVRLIGLPGFGTAS